MSVGTRYAARAGGVGLERWEQETGGAFAPVEVVGERRGGRGLCAFVHDREVDASVATDVDALGQVARRDEHARSRRGPDGAEHEQAQRRGADDEELREPEQAGRDDHRDGRREQGPAAPRERHETIAISCSRADALHRDAHRVEQRGHHVRRRDTSQLRLGREHDAMFEHCRGERLDVVGHHVGAPETRGERA